MPVSQNYLREQPDNIKSVNLIAETSSFLGLIYSAINPQTVSLVTELFNTLIEFSSVGKLNARVFSMVVVCTFNVICTYDVDVCVVTLTLHIIRICMASC